MVRDSYDPIPLVWLALVVVVGWSHCGQASFELTVMHTGTTYAQVTAVDLFNSACEPVNGTYRSTQGADPCLGGFDRRSTLIETVRATAANSMLVDAGCFFTGSLFWYLYNSTVLTKYHSQLGYQGMAVSLFEFVNSVESLAYFVETLGNDTAVLAANLENKDQDPRLVNATIGVNAVFTFGTEKVGYAATTIADMAPLFANTYQLNSSSELEGILKAVGKLQNQGVNKIVVTLSGVGVLDSVLKYVLGIDIVVLRDVYYANPVMNATVPDFDQPAGPYPRVVYTLWGQPVLIVGSGRYGKNLGVLNVTFDDNGVITSWNGNSIQLSDAIAANDTIHQEIVQDYNNVQDSLGTVVGRAAFEIQYEHRCLFGECAIGDWAVDGLRGVGQTQIGIVNGDTMSGPFARGNITLGDQLLTFPYGGQDQLWTFSLGGAHLLEALEHGLSLADNTAPPGSNFGRFPQVSGLRFTWNAYEAVGTRVVDAWVEVSRGTWRLLDPNTSYSVTTIDYLGRGGDGYSVFVDHAQGVVNSEKFLLDPLLAALNDSLHSSPLSVRVDGRITATNLTRRTCFSSANGTVCSGNGYCYRGACVCTTVGASGNLCVMSSSSASSDSLSSAAVVGIVFGAVVPLLLVLMVAVAAGAVVIPLAVARRRRGGAEEWLIDFDELERGELLGQGSYGEVYKGLWKGTEVAIKTIGHGAAAMGREGLRAFGDEVRVMSRLRHPNVVLFMAACTRPPRLCIVMEFMALGSLYDLLQNELIPDIPHGLKFKMAYQAAKGMHFLHSSGIVHRDLKSLNLLLDAKWNVKVSDFGLTGFKDSVKRKDETLALGSVPWMAPELLLEEADDVDFVLCDVYSFGIILWEILSTEVPYEGLTAAQVAIAVIRDDLRPDMACVATAGPPDGTIRDYVRLMTECWHRDKTLRPVFLDIMSRLTSIGETQGNYLSSTHTATSSSRSTSLHLRDHYTTGSGSIGSIDFDSSRHLQRERSVGPDSSFHTGSTTSSAPSQHHQLRAGAAAAPPRENVCFAVSDLARLNELWTADPAAASKAIAAYSSLVRRHAEACGAYIFSRSTLHSGGTFLLAFAQPTQAAAFALAVQSDVRAKGWSATIRSRVSLAYHPERARAPVDDHLHTGYLAKDYEQACQLNVQCPFGAVICSTEFAERLQQQHDASPPSFTPFDDVVLLGDSSEQLDNADLPDDGSIDEYEIGLCSSNACPWIINSASLTLGGTILGEGNYGQVTEALFAPATALREPFPCSSSSSSSSSSSLVQRRVAVKRLFRHRLDDGGMLNLRKEAAILSGIDHPNVVKLIGLSIADDRLMLVMELVPRGSLRSVLSSTKESSAHLLSWPQKLSFLRDAALGIAHLHSRQILHRDVKSSNLLVDDNMTVKVADFGFATTKVDNGTMTRCGTPSWTAPEILSPPTGGTKTRYTEKADVYSFGIVMWEVLTQELPYHDQDVMQVAMEVLGGGRPPVPPDCAEGFSQLMQSCWHQDPQQRPDMNAVVMALSTECDV
ncbi:5'nucleotidase [Acanthamoeba castellanii str. Neff]|uniref:non-specific serine/threonine protein kinase n=1 Tax=Acanthamoeba castellanii (strain ATCC 30010 / Neff) TaxID=1257118 RepID=L8GLC2_ACACF|nr:5'nucleotidase [Acanthamoeba castellanii str. Neff]ELR13875.1 5'nucleotidase [Acanthamoeba castellanii str. Neff]